MLVQTNCWTCFSFQSSITPQPFLNELPTRLDTIYSALCYAKKEAERLKQASCIVTFDQPLYAKAMDIVTSTPALKGNGLLKQDKSMVMVLHTTLAHEHRWITNNLSNLTYLSKFYEDNCTHEEIAASGESFLVGLYGGYTNSSLTVLRHKVNNISALMWYLVFA